MFNVFPLSFFLGWSEARLWRPVKGAVSGQCPGSNKRPGGHLRVHRFYMLHAPSPPSTQGEGNWGEVTRYRSSREQKAMVCSGTTGMWDQHSWNCSWHQNCGLRWGPRQHNLCQPGAGTKGDTNMIQDLVTVEKYKACASFHSFSSLTHIHTDTHFTLVSGSVTWYRTK